MQKKKMPKRDGLTKTSHFGKFWPDATFVFIDDMQYAGTALNNQIQQG